jgi:hypothetical protein
MEYIAVAYKQTPEEERRIREAALDDTLAATFPASDPPSTLPNPQDVDALNRESVAAHPGNDDDPHRGGALAR